MDRQPELKEIIFDNIEFILKNRKMKIGDFEKSTGVSLGYLARARKSPTISFEFILKASSFLKISINDLIDKNLQNNFLSKKIESLLTNLIDTEITYNQKSELKNLLIKLYNNGILIL